MPQILSLLVDKGGGGHIKKIRRPRGGQGMEHTTCDGCRYKRPGGVCSDPAWPVHEQVTDHGPRRCYEDPQTINEGLVLYLREHEGLKA